MRYTLGAILGAWLLAVAALTAADFWQEKDFTAWSAQQVEKMLSDSPWAKKVIIVMGSLREEALGTFQGGGGAGLGGGGGTVKDGDGGEFQRVRRVTVTVAWTSALPVRQALTRRQTGSEAQIAPDQQRQLGQDEPFYAVTVVGLPFRVVAQAGTIDDLKAKTTLRAGRKERIAPANILASREGEQTVRVEFLFPKGAAIALDDKEVEFATKLGDVDITKKFKLADMMVRGQLAL
jgi:hypothetical protein